MKRIYLFSTLSFLLIFGACTDKAPKSHDGQEAIVFEFSNSDSIDIISLADQYVACFNSGNIEGCADFLYTVRNDSVFPLSTKQREGFLSSLQRMPSFGCERTDLTLKSDRDNKVQIVIFLAEADSTDLSKERPSVKFFLNPVKVEGTWYLTLYDPHAEGVGVY